MTRPARKLHRLVHRVGLPALAAAALLIVAALLYFAGVQPLRSELAGLRTQADAAQQKLRVARLAGTAAPATVAEQLRSFHAFFPRTDSLSHWLDKIHTIGRAAGLSIRSGEYRLERQERAPWRYHVTLPVSGSYVQIRQFITFVLQEVPSASLDDVQLRREAGAGERLEARLRFSLHFSGS
jgi:hypothetical protein